MRGDGQLFVDNNWIKNQVMTIAIARNNWLFDGSLRAGQRAAAAMSLIQPARMIGNDPHAYLKDVLTRLPTHRASSIQELLPHRWQPALTKRRNGETPHRRDDCCVKLCSPPAYRSCSICRGSITSM